MATLTICGVTKAFGKQQKALDGVDLTVADGELCVIVGPAGSGKTTLLRAIAGLERIDAGTIAFDEEVVNDLRPRDRKLAMVAQKPVLFPYLRVSENIAFGLRGKGLSRADIQQKVEDSAERVGISGLLRHYPRQLSDGDIQAVAIAHAIARDAMVLLLDEPLARLDTLRRDQMRAALRRRHQEKPTTTVYVTQDQMEAMNVADRIVVMREGRIEQAGAPIELFERPATRFVAGFFGPLKMNFLAGTLRRNENGDHLVLANSEISVPLPPNRLPAETAEGTQLVLGVRPEHMMRAVRVSPPDGTLRYETEIELLQPNGPRTHATFRMGSEPVTAELYAHDVSAAGEKIAIDINLKRATLFDAETEEALMPAAADAAPKPQ